MCEYVSTGYRYFSSTCVLWCVAVVVHNIWRLSSPTIAGSWKGQSALKIDLKACLLVYIVVACGKSGLSKPLLVILFPRIASS